ncbi:MAG: Wzz/FepE/Etk N-terminal domain-containing protein [Solirubrobacterales bacterium]
MTNAMDRYETPDVRDQRGASLTDVFAIVKRQKWILLLCLVAFPAVAFAFSQSQDKLYTAETKVLLSRQSLANSLTDTPDPDFQADRERLAQTQIELAKLPTVAERTLLKLKLPDRTVDGLLASTTVSALGKTDILVIAVTDTDPEIAARIANEYAAQYTNFRARLDTAAVNRTLREVNSRLRMLDSDDKSDLYKNLEEKQQQLRTLQTLQTSNSLLVRRATSARQVQPAPFRNASLGLILGLIAGIALALVRDALDSRLRRGEDLAAAFGVPLLGRVPSSASGGFAGRIALAQEPNSATADAYRRVIGNIEYAALAHPATTIIAVSPTDSDERSELVANLGFGFARSGRKVVVVDLDFTRGSLSALFQVSDRHGVSDVAVESVTLDHVCAAVPLRSPLATLNGNSSGTNGNDRAANGDQSSVAVDHTPLGGLWILPAGTTPAEPGDFIATGAIGAVIDDLAARFDLVLLDVPALLRASDATRIARHADALIVAARPGITKSSAASECRRLIDQTPSMPLGLISTADVSASEYDRFTRFPRRQPDRAPRATPAHQ